MSVRHAAWVAQQADLRARAEDALLGRGALAPLLAGWPAPLDERSARALLTLTDPPETEELGRLVGWIEGLAPDDGEARPLSAWDARALTQAVESSPERRRVAALALLARLGDAYRLREHEAPERRVWTATPEDDELRSSWADLLGDRRSIEAGIALQRRLGGVVRASFAGVAAALRLPPELSQDLGRRALEQLDLVFPVARGELASWVVETAGEPVGALCAALGPGARAQVLACVASRALWADVRALFGLGDDLSQIPAGTAAAVLCRLSAGLAEGRAAPHELGLPGWGVVAANRARVRGRLRAAASMDLGALRRALLGLDALAARSAVALGRFSWGWAWREARSGFGFDLDRISSPACAPGPPLRGRAPPLGEAELPALRTLLLLVAGRGAWEDLERWVEGGAGRGLGRGLYRCLEAAPDVLCDPGEPGRRSRGYERLRAWLFEGGLERCLPMIAAAGARARPLSPGRDLRAHLREALSPWWDESAIPFPQHHLPGFREGLTRPMTRRPEPPPR